jgi:shikimate kinase
MPLVWLVGMMGSGKSAVGRLVALHEDCAFVDTDTVVERLAERPIRQIFTEEGEAWFREVEAAAVQSLMSHNWVVATGGGVVLRDDNVVAMQASGPVVWLRASIETLLTRVGGDDRRPLLAGAPTAQRLGDLMAERAERYAGAAGVVIDTDDLTIAQVAAAVEAVL